MRKPNKTHRLRTLRKNQTSRQRAIKAKKVVPKSLIKRIAEGIFDSHSTVTAPRKFMRSIL